MRYLALACDYDGTLAHHGSLDEDTIAGMERLRASGRRLLLVTGREMNDLQRVCSHLHLFDRIVAENGALLFDPATGDAHPLGEAPPPEFARELERRGVSPVSVGKVIVATWEPHDATVLRVIHDMGLELQVIFNKGAVMVLPTGVNKATGLRRALDVLKLSPHNTVAVGDAENDHAFLAACECGVAVANALETLKARADLVTAGDHGKGVVELIDRMIASDLAELAPRLARHDLIIGRAESGADVRIPPHDGAILIAGPSGAGKTTVTTTLLERLCELGYQFCVIDPEGDYHEFPGAIALRGADRRALAEESLRILDRPSENLVVSLIDLPLEERPSFLQYLLPRVLEMRSETGRPHWIVIDEAHHLLPQGWQPSRAMFSSEITSTIFVTVHPDHVSPAALGVVNTLIAAGRDPQATVDAFQRARGGAPIGLPRLEEGDGFNWFLRLGEAPFRYRGFAPLTERRRHRRKYAEGELGEDRSFYFRGPEGRLHLRAQNLELFIQLADGVDDDTWLYHLGRGDVSAWFRGAIKDESLAGEAAEIEARAELSAADSRARIRSAIERRYTRSV